MAATVDSSRSARNHAVFQSVFLTLVRPPQNQQLFESDTAQLAQQATKQLETDSRHVVGIKNEGYILPPGNVRSFKTHFVSCPSLSVVAQLTSQQRSMLVREMLKCRSVALLAGRNGLCARLGGDKMKRVFASVIDKLMNEFVAWAYSGTYNEEVRSHLRFWVENILAVWINTFLWAIDRGGAFSQSDVSGIPVGNLTDLERYQSMAFSKLWTLRVDELFDIIVDWDDTIAGIDDIKPLLTTPQARQYVSQRFALALQTRLLHPGASTIEILQVYISTIRAFKRLDPRGVLLSKVSGRVRQYLRERDDTIKAVVAGLLADVPMSSTPSKRVLDQSSPDVLNELAWELQNRDASAGKAASNLDWNNMNWQPDPIDAVPDQQKSSKHTDVIGSIISLFESKDIFVKELQVMLAERLLGNKDDYEQETSVIEHLKIRFGDAALQSCEVMLRDVVDSRRLDQAIRNDAGLTITNQTTQVAGNDQEAEPEIHAKILSRLFWPTLPGSTPSYSSGDAEEQPFKPPLSILHLRNLYTETFTTLKQSRTLTWNDHLGAVEIELTFADGRTYKDEVLPYQAGVIHAFQTDSLSSSPSSHPEEPITKTVDEIASEIHLSPTLVRSACLLFVSKRVLIQSPNLADAFTVLEHAPPPPSTTTQARDLSTDSTTAPTHTNADAAASAASAASAAAAQQRAAELAAQQAAREAEQKEKKAQAAIYGQFIRAMLTNQGAMPVQRIHFMLGMVVPGGVSMGVEELREVLGAMVRDGEVVLLSGGRYKMA